MFFHTLLVRIISFFSMVYIVVPIVVPPPHCFSLALCLSVCLCPPPLSRQVLSSLHPDCEYIFQLEREERRCLRYIAEQNHSTVENSTVLFNFDALQNHSMLGIREIILLESPITFSHSSLRLAHRLDLEYRLS